MRVMHSDRPRERIKRQLHTYALRNAFCPCCSRSVIFQNLPLSSNKPDNDWSVYCCRKVYLLYTYGDPLKYFTRDPENVATNRTRFRGSNGKFMASRDHLMLYTNSLANSAYLFVNSPREQLTILGRSILREKGLISGKKKVMSLQSE